MYVYAQHKTIVFLLLKMDMIVQYTEVQASETAPAVLGEISGPYTHLTKKRDEGKR